MGKVENITKDLENVNRFFKEVHSENIKLVKPTFEEYVTKASALHDEFGELLLEHGSKMLGCDEDCISDCLDKEFVSFWELPKCIKHCKCERGALTIEREDHMRRELESDRIHDSIEKEELEEILEEDIRRPHLKKEEQRKERHHERVPHESRRRRDENDFDLPELMKYSEYDKKAWALFKKHQDDI